MLKENGHDANGDNNITALVFIPTRRCWRAAGAAPLPSQSSPETKLDLEL